MNVELHQIREEIRKADEALVRELAAAPDADVQAWSSRAAVRSRVQLGVKVAECKFRYEPDRFRALARARNEQDLDRAITDARMEAAVLERVRQQALKLGSDSKTSGRMADFYRDWIIPETKKVQIRRLCELG